eukprot:1505061-Rhodomonas_salina.1
MREARGREGDQAYRGRPSRAPRARRGHCLQGAPHSTPAPRSPLTSRLLVFNTGHDHRTPACRNRHRQREGEGGRAVEGSLLSGGVGGGPGAELSSSKPQGEHEERRRDGNEREREREGGRATSRTACAICSAPAPPSPSVTSLLPLRTHVAQGIQPRGGRSFEGSKGRGAMQER